MSWSESSSNKIIPALYHKEGLNSCAWQGWISPWDQTPDWFWQQQQSLGWYLSVVWRIFGGISRAHPLPGNQPCSPPVGHWVKTRNSLDCILNQGIWSKRWRTERICDVETPAAGTQPRFVFYKVRVSSLSWIAERSSPFQIKTAAKLHIENSSFFLMQHLQCKKSLGQTPGHCWALFIPARRGRKTQKFTFSRKHLQTAVLTMVTTATGSRAAHRDAEKSHPAPRFIPAVQELTGSLVILRAAK